MASAADTVASKAAVTAARRVRVWSGSPNAYAVVQSRAIQAIDHPSRDDPDHTYPDATACALHRPITRTAVPRSSASRPERFMPCVIGVHTSGTEPQTSCSSGFRPGSTTRTMVAMEVPPTGATNVALPADPPAELRRRFDAAQPFPHLVLDGVLDVDPASVVAEFPAEQWPGWTRYRDEYQRRKLTCSDLAAMPPVLRELTRELCEPAFLGFLEAVTGLAGLVPDPYLEGGGLHAGGAGATLTPHTDFHVYPRLGLFRRVNVLLYLNPGWTTSDGGALELFGPDMTTPAASIDPVFGRMVIFRTDDRSPHGFTRPVAAGRYRRSLALYYYTAEEAPDFSGDTNTYWKTHGDTTGTSRRTRLAAYRALLTGSRALSMLAHRCNPNLGARVRPERPDDQVC